MSPKDEGLVEDLAREIENLTHRVLGDVNSFGVRLAELRSGVSKPLAKGAGKSTVKEDVARLDDLQAIVDGLDPRKDSTLKI